MGSRTCQGCGTVHHDQAAFCRRCGAQIAEAPEAFKPGVKKGTVVDPNLAGGQAQGGGDAPRRPVDQWDAAPPPPPRVKKGTVVDSSAPVKTPGRKLVGFLVSYDLDPGKRGCFFPLYQGSMKIGREGSATDIQLADGGVSEVHAKLRYLNGRLVIQDDMSSNGTWVDVETVPRQKYPGLHGGDAGVKPASFDGKAASLVCIEDERIPLRDGSLLKLGNAVLEVKLVGWRPGAGTDEQEQ
ncbi:MAG: FHA domain-containing protein [Deltaproteobacteria bacterium]|nr:FHA domain-containing protein [Deltaproteobacteria bacterium]